jgi:hypothetical protein
MEIEVQADDVDESAQHPELLECSLGLPGLLKCCVYFTKKYGKTS